MFTHHYCRPCFKICTDVFRMKTLKWSPLSPLKTARMKLPSYVSKRPLSSSWMPMCRRPTMCSSARRHPCRFHNARPAGALPTTGRYTKLSMVVCTGVTISSYPLLLDWNRHCLLLPLFAEQKNSVPDADEVVNARNAVEDRAASGGGDDDDTKSAAIARSSARDNRSNAPAALINDTRLTNLLQLCECVLLQNQYYAKLVSFKAIIVPPRLWEFIGDACEWMKTDMAKKATAR